MISHLYHERQQTLPQSSPSKPATDISLPKAPDLGEPCSEERREAPWRFLGNTTAQEALPALGLSFKSLRQSYYVREKPILGVGESYSTVAAEAALLNLPVYATDLSYDTKREAYLSGIIQGLEKLKNRYTTRHLMPQGFSDDVIAPDEWSNRLAYIRGLLNDRMSQCRASMILLPDGTPAPNQSFDTVYSHHGVPKYSTRETFLLLELPELLRVTHRRLILAPFVSAGPGDELLHVPNSENRNRVELISNACGFSLEIRTSQTLAAEVRRGLLGPGFDQVGIFFRQRGRM